MHFEDSTGCTAPFALTRTARNPMGGKRRLKLAARCSIHGASSPTRASVIAAPFVTTRTLSPGLKPRAASHRPFSRTLGTTHSCLRWSGPHCRCIAETVSVRITNCTNWKAYPSGVGGCARRGRRLYRSVRKFSWSKVRVVFE